MKLTINLTNKQYENLKQRAAKLDFSEEEAVEQMLYILTDASESEFAAFMQLDEELLSQEILEQLKAMEDGDDWDDEDEDDDWGEEDEEFEEDDDLDEAEEDFLEWEDDDETKPKKNNGPMNLDHKSDSINEANIFKLGNHGPNRSRN